MYSIEILPAHTQRFMEAYDQFGSKLDKSDLRVLVPHLNGTSYQSILDSCSQLKQNGYLPVAHLAVRNIRQADRVDQIIQGICDLELTELLVLGGDSPDAECFKSVFEFLEQGHLAETPIKRLFFSTFADGHPHVEDDQEAITILKQKTAWAEQQGYAIGLMTQLCFESDMMLDHITQLQAQGVTAEVSAGFVAPCKFSKLVQMASLVGLKNAMSFIKKINVLKLLKEYDSDTYIQPLLASGRTGSTHAYPFGNYEGALKKLALYHTK